MKRCICLKNVHGSQLEDLCFFTKLYFFHCVLYHIGSRGKGWTWSPLLYNVLSLRFFKNSNLFGKSRKIVAFFMILNEVVLLSLNQY